MRSEFLGVRAHEGAVYAAGFSSDGTRIVSGSDDGTVRISWIGRTKQELKETARARLPRQLTDDERRRFHLAVERAASAEDQRTLIRREFFAMMPRSVSKGEEDMGE